MTAGVQNVPSLDVKEEISMAIINMAGHYGMAAVWADHLNGMYKKAICKHDPALGQRLHSIVNFTNSTKQVFAPYVKQDDEALDIFTKHLGAFFNKLRRATPEQKRKFFEELDDLQVRFGDEVDN